MALSPDPSRPASTRMNLRPEPLVRVAVPRAAHPPAYVAKLRKAWRVVVPVRGRLSPRLIAREFPTQSAALRWLASEDGHVRLPRNAAALDIAPSAGTHLRGR